MVLAGAPHAAASVAASGGVSPPSPVRFGDRRFRARFLARHRDPMTGQRETFGARQDLVVHQPLDRPFERRGIGFGKHALARFLSGTPSLSGLAR